MQSMFDLARPMLTAGLVAGFGSDATLKRGVTSVPVVVILQGGGTDRQYMTRLGTSPEDTVYTLYPPEAGYCAFCVKVADYATFTPALPQRGDQLLFGSDIYIVTAPVGTEPWKYTDDLPYKEWFWLHTKLK
jgi:hypothetical protein